MLLKALVRTLLPADLRMTLWEIRQRPWKRDLTRWCTDWLPDQVIQRTQFQRAFGRRLRFGCPQTFNEKLHWLMRYDRRPILTTCADKYAVRQYVTERIGPNFLNALYGVWTDPADIPFDQLPESFVLKVTHGSGQNLFCQHKPTVLEPLRAQLARWLQRSEYWVSREWAYKEIPPRIICEEFLTDESGKSPADYKFFCFDGEPRMIQVDTDRFTAHHRDLFDVDWRPLPFGFEFPSSGQTLPKPRALATMLTVARTLSQGHPFVRVDLYALGERVIMGEMTWYPEGGLGHFLPERYDRLVGEWMQLPKGTRPPAL